MGIGGTSQWKVCSLNPSTTLGIYFEVVNQVKDAGLNLSFSADMDYSVMMKVPTLITSNNRITVIRALFSKSTNNGFLCGQLFSSCK